MKKGIKYSANFWIHMYEFQQSLQKGCDNSDYFQDGVEAILEHADGGGGGGGGGGT